MNRNSGASRRGVMRGLIGTVGAAAGPDRRHRLPEVCANLAWRPEAQPVVHDGEPVGLHVAGEHAGRRTRIVSSFSLAWANFTGLHPSERLPMTVSAAWMSSHVLSADGHRHPLRRLIGQRERLLAAHRQAAGLPVSAAC